MSVSSTKHDSADSVMRAMALALAASLVCAQVEAKVIALDVDIILDKVAPDHGDIKVGQHHEARVYYDDTQVDPVTRRVALLHEQHTPALIPKHLNPGHMPMSNAWLDLSTTPYGYHFAAAPTIGFPDPYFILFDEKTRRMTIYKQSDGSLLLTGAYTVNPTPITGPQIDAVVASSEPHVPPWVTTLKMPPMPAGEHMGGKPAGAGK